MASNEAKGQPGRHLPAFPVGLATGIRDRLSSTHPSRSPFMTEKTDIPFRAHKLCVGYSA